MINIKFKKIIYDCITKETKEIECEESFEPTFEEEPEFLENRVAYIERRLGIDN